MLTEIAPSRQVPGDPKRRWFTSPDIDLYVWLDDAGRPVGFQLCYDKRFKEHALTWTQKHGFSHTGIEDGGSRPARYKGTPILIADGKIDVPRILEEFQRESRGLPEEIVRMVEDNVRRLFEMPWSDDRVEALKAQIRHAFAHVEFPGDWCLRGSNEGEEPYLVEEDFKGKTDWSVLDPKFLDRAPDGFGTALSFFSDEAFHFYLPAYLIADIDDQLEQHTPWFHLTHGFDDASRDTKINPQRYGERTWFEAARCKHAMFNREEAAAIVQYLRWRRDTDDFARPAIDQALRNYWNGRIGPDSEGATP